MEEKQGWLESPIIKQIFLPVLFAAMGGWTGVQITIAQVSGAIDEMNRNVSKLEIKMNDSQQDRISLRERITRLEVEVSTCHDVISQIREDVAAKRNRDR